MIVVFAQITHGHNGRQQRGERQSHRDHVDRGVAEQFDDRTGIESFADQLVDVAPQYIHHQHEHDDEERQHHGSQIGLENEFIDGFHRRGGVF